MGLEMINIIKKKKGITTKQLSEKSNIPVGTLNKILTGVTKNPAYETIFTLANALECPVDMFCNDTTEEKLIHNVLSKEEAILLENYNKLNTLGKDEANKRVAELTEINKYTYVEQHIGMAAHNDFAYDEEQQRLMQEDLDEL